MPPMSQRYNRLKSFIFKTKQEFEDPFSEKRTLTCHFDDYFLNFLRVVRAFEKPKYVTIYCLISKPINFVAYFVIVELIP